MGLLRGLGIFIVILILLFVGFSVYRTDSGFFTKKLTISQGNSTYPQLESTENNSSLQNALWSYGDTGSGWTGADGTYSLALPNGTTLWIFDDTYLGYGFNPNNDTRDQNSPYVHNSIVLENNGRFITTIIGNDNGMNNALIYQNNSSYWFWPGPAMINGNTVQILMGNFSAGYAFHGTYLAVLNLSDLAVEKVLRVSTSMVQWDQWIYRDGSWTYIFGIYNNTADAYVARVSGTNLSQSWQFYSSSGWTSVESDATPFFSYAANGYSVTKIQNYFVLVTTDATSYPLSVFDGKILAYFSDSITGPYTSSELIYNTTPEIDAYSDNSSVYTVWTYGPHVQYTGSNWFVLSYNMNGISMLHDYTIPNATVYRPRFINVYFS